MRGLMLALVSTVVLFATHVQAVPLPDIINAGTLIVGDKTFSLFDVTGASPGPLDVSSAVGPFSATIRFSGPLAESTEFEPFASNTDYFTNIGFQVSVNNPQFRIIGVTIGIEHSLVQSAQLVTDFEVDHGPLSSLIASPGHPLFVPGLHHVSTAFFSGVTQISIAGNASILYRYLPVCRRD